MGKWATNSPVTAGLALVVAGFIAIFLAWNNAAGLDYVQGQIPYLISGGLAGLCLVGAGLTVVNVQTRRADQAELVAKLDELADLLRDDDDAADSRVRRPRQKPLRAVNDQ